MVDSIIELQLWRPCTWRWRTAFADLMFLRAGGETVDLNLH